MKSFSVNQIIAIWKYNTSDSLVLSGFSLVALGNNQNQKNLPTKTRIFHYTTNEKFKEGYLKNSLQQQNDYGKVINKIIPLWLKKLKIKCWIFFACGKALKLTLSVSLNVQFTTMHYNFAPYHDNFLEFFFKKTVVTIGRAMSLGTVLIHFYCISWHVNSFAGFRKALLELNVNFRYQNLWKNTFVVKVTKFSSDSLDKNWNNIYYSWRQQAFIISNVSYFERQNLRKFMS